MLPTALGQKKRMNSTEGKEEGSMHPSSENFPFKDGKAERKEMKKKKGGGGFLMTQIKPFDELAALSQTISFISMP